MTLSPGRHRGSDQLLDSAASQIIWSRAILDSQGTDVKLRNLSPSSGSKLFYPNHQVQQVNLWSWMYDAFASRGWRLRRRRKRKGRRRRRRRRERRRRTRGMRTRRKRRGRRTRRRSRRRRGRRRRRRSRRRRRRRQRRRRSCKEGAL